MLSSVSVKVEESGKVFGGLQHYHIDEICDCELTVKPLKFNAAIDTLDNIISVSHTITIYFLLIVELEEWHFRLLLLVQVLYSTIIIFST